MTDDELKAIIEDPKNRMRNSELLLRLIHEYTLLREEQEPIEQTIRNRVREERAKDSLRNDLANLVHKHGLYFGPTA